MKFEKEILIHFGDVDPQGILYHARVYELAHECLEEFWAQSSLGWSFWFQNPEFAVPLRHSSADFLKPMRAGEKFKTVLSLHTIGESSVEFRFEFVDAKKAVCAQVTSVHVFVDRTKFAKISVPESARRILS